MSSVLVISLPSAARRDDPVEWAIVRDAAVIAAGVAEPGRAPDWPGGEPPSRAVALLPSEDVFVRRLPVPGRSERDARRAAPFLIEEHLAQSPDQLAVEVGPVGADGARWVFAVDQEARENWRGQLAAFGVRPLSAIPDAMVLSGYGGDLTVAEIGGRVLYQARSGDLAAFEPDADDARDPEAAAREPVCGAIDADLVADMLPALGLRLRPRRLLISDGIDPRAVAPDDAPVALKRAPAPDLRLAAAAMDPDRLALAPALFGAGFASTVDWRGLMHPWRVAAGLALVAILGFTALNAGQAAYYEARANAYRDAEIAAFEQAFPELRVVNVQAQLRQQLAAVGAVSGGPGFLELTAGLAAVLDGQGSVQIEAIRYDAERDSLSVSALYAEFGDFETLRAAADQAGVVLEDGGARQSANGVAGEFTVRLP